MVRIEEGDSCEVNEDSFLLLGWLVCAKRPLKWHEIQGMKAINFDKQSIEYDREKFVVGPKDLFASFVESRPDGSLELVHLSAKL